MRNLGASVRRCGSGRGATVLCGAMILAMMPLADGWAQEEPRGTTPPGDVGVVQQVEHDLVHATGDAIVRAAPDRAHITLTAEAQDRAPDAAQAKNAKVMAAVQARIEALGIPKEALRTTSLDLQPLYDYHEGKRIFRGYMARNSIRVRVDDIARVGDVVDASVKAGATEVSSIQFDLQQREEIERQALREAVEDARARAEAMAAAAGRTLARIVRLDDQIRPSPPAPQPMMAMQERAAMDASTPVAPGELEVRARVSLTATLK